MQLIGIILLFLVGLSGSEDILGKKCAWLSIRKTTILQARLPYKGESELAKKSPPTGAPFSRWGQEARLRWAPCLVTNLSHRNSSVSIGKSTWVYEYYSRIGRGRQTR
jgi:hypothetical protein